MSQDSKAWMLPVGLAGELGTPESYARTRGSPTSSITPSPGSGLTVNLTGPAATVADLTEAGRQDRLPIELAIAVLLLVILAVIYRNPVTMMLPLITIGASLMTAQGVVAGISQLTGLAISNQTIVFLSAMIAGAGTDYAVFLISRYHDYVRLGDGLGPSRTAGAGVHRQGDRRVRGDGGQSPFSGWASPNLACSPRSAWRWRSGSAWRSSPR